MDALAGPAVWSAVSAVGAAAVTAAGAVGHWVRLRCRVRHAERLVRTLPPGSVLEESYEGGGGLRLSIPPATGATEPAGQGAEAGGARE
jgi:hypothetical protein